MLYTPLLIDKLIVGSVKSVKILILRQTRKEL